MLEYSERQEPNQGLLLATANFYHAFESVDIASMSNIWSRSDKSFCIHPGWEPIFTWEEIRVSWENIFRTSSLMMFQIEVIQSFVDGNNGTVLCKENISSVINGRATNFSILAVNTFELEIENWKLMSHHGSPV